MSATTASRFDRQQASDVCVQSPEMCLSQKRLPPVTDCQVIGAREQSDTLQVGGGSFGMFWIAQLSILQVTYLSNMLAFLWHLFNLS